MHFNSITRSLLASVSLFTLVPFGGIVADAQAQSGDDTEANEVRAFDKIVVTARKREEGLQDVPLSVSTLGSQDIERGGIDSLEDVANFTPGLTYQEFNGGGLGSPVIRGLSQTDIGSFDNNVGMFLDGVFLSAKANLDISLFDIERVEVTRGPQSALYGNNSFSGAVNYVTKAPSEDMQRASFTIGSDERYEASASLGGEIVEDVLSGRVSLGYSEFDGTIENEYTSENLGGYDEKTAISGSLLWTPTDAFEATLFAYSGEEQIDGSAAFMEVNNCGGPNSLNSDTTTGRGGSIFRYFCGTPDIPERVSVFPEAFSKRESLLTYLKMSLDLGIADLNSTTSYGDYKANALSDQFLSSGAAPEDRATRRFTRPFIGDTKEFSQEVRLESFDRGMFDWSVGAYYIDREVDEDFQTGTGAAFFGDEALVLNRMQVLQSEAISGFGLLGMDVTDKFSVSGEVRYTRDKREFSSSQSSSGAPFVEQSDSETFEYTTFRTTADYQLNENVLLFASAASGAKSGGFNVSADASEATFEEETNITYEAGTKLDILGGRGVFNAAAFYVEWSDLQLPVPSSIPGNANVTQNFGNATAAGVELDLMLQLTDNTDVRLGYAYSDATFDEGVEDNTAARRCNTPEDCGEAGPNGGVLVGGNRLPRSAEHQLSASGTQYFPSSWGEFYLRGDLSYQSERYSTPLNLQDDGGRTLVNARLGLEVNENVDISLWSNNLFDEEYINSTINEPEFFPSSTFSTAFMGNGRTFGVTLNLKR